MICEKDDCFKTKSIRKREYTNSLSSIKYGFKSRLKIKNVGVKKEEENVGIILKLKKCLRLAECSPNKYFLLSNCFAHIRRQLIFLNSSCLILIVFTY